MHRTRKKKHKAGKNIIRRTIWNWLPCILMALILTMAWRLTSRAIRYLAPEQEEGPLYESYESEKDANVSISRDTEEEAPAFSSNLLLVNKSHPLENAYAPSLKRIRTYGADVDASICGALTQMLEDGEKEGLNFWIASAYRSERRQRELLDEDIGKLIQKGYSYSEAYEEAVRQTMPVGCSEHATGLAIDIVSQNYQILDEKQASTREILWLQENCSRYGFILRYPKGKEEITGVSYESWHFRYVGAEAAKEIMEQGITLEEYLESSE